MPPDDQAAPGALLALRERTRELHLSLEASVAIAASDAGRAAYARHVAALWGWIVPLERVLWQGPWPEGIRPAERAVKARWLESDLAVASAAGFAVPLASCPPIELATLPARFGAAYVIEGSMLGGVMLLGRLGERLAPWPLHYLRGYGADGARYWREFLSELARHVTTRDDVAAAAEGAHAAFVSIGGWLRSRGAA